MLIILSFCHIHAWLTLSRLSGDCGQAHYAIWEGVIYPPEHYKAKYLVDEVRYVDELPQVCNALGCSYRMRSLLVGLGPRMGAEGSSELKPTKGTRCAKRVPIVAAAWAFCL